MIAFQAVVMLGVSNDGFNRAATFEEFFDCTGYFAGALGNQYLNPAGLMFTAAITQIYDRLTRFDGGQLFNLFKSRFQGSPIIGIARLGLNANDPVAMGGAGPFTLMKTPSRFAAFDLDTVLGGAILLE